jgi:hypothetical protein
MDEPLEHATKRLCLEERGADEASRLPLFLLAEVISFTDLRDHMGSCRFVSRHWLEACKQRLSWFPSRSRFDLWVRHVAQCGSDAPHSEVRWLSMLSQKYNGSLSYVSLEGIESKADSKSHAVLLRLLETAALTRLYFGWLHDDKWIHDDLRWVRLHSNTLTRLDLSCTEFTDDQWGTLVSSTPQLNDLRLALPSFARLAALDIGRTDWCCLTRVRLLLWGLDDASLLVPFACFMRVASLVVQFEVNLFVGCTEEVKERMAAWINACSNLETLQTSMTTLVQLSKAKAGLRLPSVVDCKLMFFETPLASASKERKNLYRKEPLHELPRLRSLSLQSCPIPEFMGNRMLCRSPLRLDTLHLESVFDLRPQDFTDIGDGILNMPSLRYLTLSGCMWRPPRDEYSHESGTMVCSGRTTFRGVCCTCFVMVKNRGQRRKRDPDSFCYRVFGKGDYPIHLCVRITM